MGKKIKHVEGDIVGGSLIEKIVRNPNGSASYKMRCPCGKGFRAPASAVYSRDSSGKFLSCGCAKYHLRLGSNKNNISTGVRGVSFNGRLYVATITVNRKFIYLGSSPVLEEATEMRLAAERKYFPDVSNWSK